ncbi:MAG: hypothetical protein JW984_14125 [Deltaproteobacteria bacterium]|uniref:Uncharacterized protein n=1 Tax=Candidatus Zymogenus saltonus TaxID=2844893 RepID=A0A9D8KHY4_9DELT|nr:hypothetical protein [Candidatus Zymogenus saltonus]
MERQDTGQERNIESRKKRRIARRAGHIVGMVFLGLTFTFLFALLFGYVIMWLWNWLIPAIFGLDEITFWQAFGIIIMARLLFTGLRMYPPHNSKFKNFNGHIADHKRAFFDKDWDFMFSRRNWRHYKEFWEEEGKAAYEEYVKKAEEKKK